MCQEESFYLRPRWEWIDHKMEQEPRHLAKQTSGLEGSEVSRKQGSVAVERVVWGRYPMVGPQVLIVAKGK